MQNSKCVCRPRGTREGCELPLSWASSGQYEQGVNVQESSIVLFKNILYRHKHDANIHSHLFLPVSICQIFLSVTINQKISVFPGCVFFERSAETFCLCVDNKGMSSRRVRGDFTELSLTQTSNRWWAMFTWTMFLQHLQTLKLPLTLRHWTTIYTDKLKGNSSIIKHCPYGLGGQLYT